MKNIHQFLPTITPFDAISNEAIVIQKELSKLGYNSQIYAENIHPSLKKRVNHYKKYNKTKNEKDIFIYHHSIGCNLLDFMLSWDSKIIMIYNLRSLE